MLTWNIPFSYSAPNSFISIFSQRCFLGNESSKFVTCCVICILFYLFWTLLFQVSKGMPAHLNICREGAWQRHELALQTHLLVEVSQVAHCCPCNPQFPNLWRKWTTAGWNWLVSGYSGILGMSMICKGWILHNYALCCFCWNKLCPKLGQLFRPRSPETSSCAAKLALLLVN